MNGMMFRVQEPSSLSVRKAPRPFQQSGNTKTCMIQIDFSLTLFLFQKGIETVPRNINHWPFPSNIDKIEMISNSCLVI